MAFYNNSRRRLQAKNSVGFLNLPAHKQEALRNVGLGGSTFATLSRELDANGDKYPDITKSDLALAWEHNTGLAAPRIAQPEIEIIDLGFEIFLSQANAVVETARDIILQLLDERKRAGRKPIVCLISPDNQTEDVYAPNAYMAIINDHSLSWAGRADPEMQLRISQFDALHETAWLQIVDLTDAMLATKNKASTPATLH
jgi:hypothetical protein